MGVQVKKAEASTEDIQKMMAEATDIGDDIEKLKEAQTKVYQRIADKTCPYKVGQTIITQTGLGKHGLKIDKIVPATYPSMDNKWGMETFALSKAGEVTRRGVLILEMGNDIVGLKP